MSNKLFIGGIIITLALGVIGYCTVSNRTKSNICEMGVEVSTNPELMEYCGS